MCHALAKPTDAQRLLRLGGLPSADHRRGADARRGRWASRSWSATTTTFDFDATRSSARWCSTRPPTATICDYAAFVEQAHAAGALVAVAADLLAPDAAARRRASSAPTSPSAARSASACRWATAARTRPTSPRATSYKRHMPGRIVGVSKDAHGQPCAAPGAADPRAAHPPREGHEQHLHRAGAAGRHGRHVRRLPRPRRAAARSPQRVHALTAALARGLQRLGLRGRPRAVSSTPCASTLGAASAAGIARRAEARADQPAPAIDDAHDRHRARRDDDRATTSRTSARASPASRRADFTLERAGRRASTPAARFARTSALPDPPGLQPLPLRDGDAALPPAPASRATSRSTTR